MKKGFKQYIALTLALGLLIPSVSFGAPKIEYGKFIVGGKTQKIALANVSVDSAPLTVSSGEVPPLVIDSRTLVPVKLVTEKLGAQISWNAKTEEVTIKKSDKTIVLKINSSTAKVNGKSKTLPDKVSPIIVNSRTMVPLKFIADEFSLTVNYNAANNSTNLISKSGEHVNDALFPADTVVNTEDILGSLDLSGVTVVQNNSNNNSVDSNSNSNQLPIVDVDNTISTPQGSNNQVNTSTSLAKQVSYNLVQQNMDNEIFSITGTSGLSSSSFFLSDPERLVIDIQGAAINSSLDANKFYSNSAFIKEMNSYYHASENKLRITLKLKDDTKREEVQIKQNPASVDVTYKSQKPKNSNMTYSADRINSKFELRLLSSYNAPTVNFDMFSNVVELTIPSSVSNLQPEIRNVDDRNISSIEVINQGQDTKIKFKLKERVNYALTDNGINSKIGIKFTKQNRTKPLIVVDAGHGAKDPGAVSGGSTEKELNLIISQKLSARLKQEGYEIITTRDTDVFIELVDRAAAANNSDADLFISIHHNAAGSSAANGIETLYYPSDDNKALAQIFHSEMVKASGANDRKIIPRANLVVLNRTKMPAALLELGYMTNSSELANLKDDAYQNAMVEGIVKAVNRYFKGY